MELKLKLKLKLSEMTAEQTNEELRQLVWHRVPFYLEDDGWGHSIEWNPCENWGQLGWLLEFTEKEMGVRLIVENSEGRHHEKQPEYDFHYRAMVFIDTPETDDPEKEMRATGDIGRLQLAKLILGKFRKKEEKKGELKK